MKINRQQFIETLLKVKPGLSNSEIIEQSSNFIFDNKVVRTFNDEIAITHQFETGLVGVVPAREFYALFNKITDEEIDSAMENEKFIFKGKGKRITFNINPEIKIQNIEAAGPRSKVWMSLPKNFSECIKCCSFSVSKNITSLELTCISVCGENTISCDSVRATSMLMDSEVEQEFLLPSAAAQVIGNYNPSRFYTDENWIHFINKENTTFSCRKIDREYPIEAIKNVFDVKGKTISLPSELKDTLERSKILVSNDLDEKEVKLTFKKGKLICQSDGIVGQIIEEIKLDYKGADLIITVNPKLLIEILERVTTAIVGDNKMLFKDESGFKHIIQLIENEEETAKEKAPKKESKAKRTKKKAK